VDNALRFQPELGDARLALAYYYYYGYRDYELARTELAIAQQATPNDAEVWDGLAAVDRRQGRWDEALTYFEKARELDPRNSAVLWNLAETYSSHCRFEEAERVFAEGLAIHPEAHFFALAQAAIKLGAEGDVEPLHAALRKIPKDFNPGGAVTLIALQVSLIKRDYAEAERVLAASHHDRLNDSGIGGAAAVFDGCTLPKAWYEGRVARAQGKMEAAERSFAAAQRVVEGDLVQWRDDAKSMAALGTLHAMRGRKDEAIKAGREAVELLPISKDAFDGPSIATKLAVIYAQTGEVDLAIELLADLVQRPNGPTPGMLRLEPEWEPLRSDPGFQKLAQV
jgi:tetratricopeptide (TPR) repeat protein